MKTLAQYSEMYDETLAQEYLLVADTGLSFTDARHLAEDAALARVIRAAEVDAVVKAAKFLVLSRASVYAQAILASQVTEAELEPYFHEAEAELQDKLVADILDGSTGSTPEGE